MLLLHCLYLLFDEGNLLLVKTVFGVKLTVNFRNGFRPVNVTLWREVLNFQRPGHSHPAATRAGGQVVRRLPCRSVVAGRAEYVGKTPIC